MMSETTLSPYRLLKILVGVGVGLAFLVVVLGAYTRLVDAGLGCPDWPGCYGQFLAPDSPEEIERAESLFPDSPVDIKKAWTEMAHRYLATGLGLLIIGVVVLAWRAKTALTLPVILLILVVVQGIFGAWTVTLKLLPQVVTAHLLGGFATLGLLWVYFVRLLGFDYLAIPPAVRRHAYVFLAVLIVQISLGGWVSSNYAALSCPDFPLCQGALFPPMDVVEGFNLMQEIGPNYTGGELSMEARIAIHNAHRWGAYFLIIVGIALMLRVSRPMRLVIGVVLGLQFTLGAANVMLGLPLWVAVMHNAGAALLLLTTLAGIFGSQQMTVKPDRVDSNPPRAV